jgi:hypothetical protein
MGNLKSDPANQNDQHINPTEKDHESQTRRDNPNDATIQIMAKPIRSRTFTKLPIYPITKFYLLLSRHDLRGNAFTIKHFIARALWVSTAC